jgi:hypothetical protein
MKITVQITVKSDEAKSEVVREVACLERGPLHPETLGLSLAEARSILAGLEQTLVEQRRQNLSPKRGAALNAAGSARARGTTKSCSVRLLAN